MRIIEKPYGKIALNNESEDPVIQHLRNSNVIFDSHVVDEIIKYSSKDKTIIDVGAYIGEQIVYYANFYKNVVCFEPIEVNYNNLLKNLELNEIKNVEAFNFGLSDENSMSNIQSSGANASFHKSITGNFQLKRLDSLNLQNCDVIKIDCESFDYNVLVGAVETIKRFRPIIIFEVIPSVEIIPQNYVDFFNLISYNIERILHHNDYIAKPNK
jgi:FkbM family methyltransferase